MFDTIEKRTSVTGILQRSNENSFFVKFHQNSKLADKFFEPNPKYNDKPISIIQVMLVHQGYMLVEYINL